MNGIERLAEATVIRAWFAARKAQIHHHVTAAQVLARYGVSLRHGGDIEEQISCPFHGTDRKPSARYFPTSGRSMSHVWCFVCHENWDAIGLWKKFTGTEKFGHVLGELERAFGLTPPAHGLSAPEPERDPLEEEVARLLDKCEGMLRAERGALSMSAALKLGSVLDGVRFDVDQGRLALPEARVRATKLLQTIGERSRASQVASAHA